MLDIILDEHIINIIRNNKIFEQRDLQKMLKDVGLNIPQATISRRLKKLNIVKINGIYQSIEYNQSYLPIVLNMHNSDSGLIVMHTPPGQANSLAYYIDRKYLNQGKNPSSNIIGTIAGDDTILIILKDKSEIKETLELLHSDFPYLASFSTRPVN